MKRRKRTKTKLQLRYGAHPSFSLTRRVWAVVTQRPNAPVRQIAAKLGSAGSYSNVAAALHLLRDAGYIAFDDRTTNTRQILLHFILQEAYPHE
jgi:hypothetical protein